MKNEEDIASLRIPAHLTAHQACWCTQCTWYTMFICLHPFNACFTHMCVGK